MKPQSVVRCCFLWVLLLGSSSALAADAAKKLAPKCGALHPAQYQVIDRWRGTWDIKAVNRRQPATEITYSETFEWVLDRCFLRSETSRKSDGGQSVSMVWFDTLTKNYRFVIFDASGGAVELPPPAWDEATQTMEWKSSRLAPFSYAAYVTFKDRDTIQWGSLWKNWNGAVILDLDGVSIRRK